MLCDNLEGWDGVEFGEEVQERKAHSFEWKDLWVKRQSNYMDKYIEKKEKFFSKGFFLGIFTSLQFLELNTEKYL